MGNSFSSELSLFSLVTPTKGEVVVKIDNPTPEVVHAVAAILHNKGYYPKAVTYEGKEGEPLYGEFMWVGPNKDGQPLTDFDISYITNISVHHNGGTSKGTHVKALPAGHTHGDMMAECSRLRSLGYKIVSISPESILGPKEIHISML